MSRARALAAALAWSCLGAWAAGAVCTGCATRSEARSSGAVVADDKAPRVEDAFDGEPEVLVVVRPKKLSRDPLYGPLLRRASELAADRAAVASAVGTTALAALQRADEVLFGLYEPRSGDAVVAVRGVPADVEAARVVDTSGRAIWAHVRDLPGGVEELGAADPAVEASLFVLPRRAWIIAAGPAVARVRRAYLDGARAHDAHLGAFDPDALASARLRPDALIRLRPQLASGPLAPVTRDLETATLSLEPGPEGQVGEIAARFVYGDAPFASDAEASFRDVVGAFVRAYEAQAPWLHAVTVAHEDRAVTLRGHIPRAWVDGFLHLDLAVPAERDGVAGQPADAGAADIPSKFRTMPFDRPSFVQ
jgi:hypothetical protein